MDFKLRRDERLTSRKQIEYLFAQGKSMNEFPLHIRWNFVPNQQPFPVKVMFSVSKKKFKRAVDRNRIKRLLREAYRKNKWLAYQPLQEKGKQIHLSFVFTGKEEISFEETEGKIILSLQRLITEISKVTD